VPFPLACCDHLHDIIRPDALLRKSPVPLQTRNITLNTVPRLQFNWMQWLTKQLYVLLLHHWVDTKFDRRVVSAWFGQKVLGASGAETFVAIWSPWFGQVNSAVLVGPYVESMTDTEIFTVMATCKLLRFSHSSRTYSLVASPAMSSISSLMIATYATTLAVPIRSLLAQSAMIIPGAIINAKVAFPEADAEKPVTRSRESTCAARKQLKLRKAHDLVDALSDGASVGLRVSGLVL
jgi:concentrative nucleoside transporter, CNT family